jgi:uncharacterized protein YjeT (DUF2065 family)
MSSSGSGISYVTHQLFCFGVGFSLCWFIEGLFVCLAPFLWHKVSVVSAGPLLLMHCDGLLIVFNFAASFYFGCSSLAQDMNFVDHYLPISGTGLSPACCQPFCLFSLCLLKVCMEISSFLLPPSLVHFQQIHPSVTC